MSYYQFQGVFLAADRVRIFYRSWRVSNARAVLVICHGLGDHSGRYGNLVQYLEGQGISVYASDHRGSGMSGGLRGHVDDFAKFHRDIKQFVETVVKPENKGAPIIMMGHSLGGLIAELYALDFPEDIRALVLSAPALYPVIPVPVWKKTIAKAAAKLYPRLSMNNGIDPELLSSDKKVVKDYIEDPLTHDLVSAKFYAEYLKHVDLAIERAFELAMPLLVIHGTGDKIISARSSEYVYEAAASKDKNKVIFEGLLHETMNEPVSLRTRVLKVLADWIAEKAGGKQKSLIDERQVPSIDSKKANLAST